MKIFKNQNTGKIEIKGKHSKECDKLYKQIKFEDNHELLNDRDDFKIKCYQEYEKIDIYKKSLYWDICHKNYNNNEWRFKFTKKWIYK